MKKTIIMTAGILSLSLAIYVSNKVGAQTGAPAAPTPKTKVGLLNLTYVIKNYDKFKNYNEELKSVVAPFQAKDTALKTEGDKLVKQAQDVKTTAEQREAIGKQLKEIERKVEDNKQDAQKVVMKKQADQMKTLYLDVRQVVERHAQSQGFEMVLHYNDAVTTEEYWGEANIARKMQAGALMPLYIANGLDISVNVVTLLNNQYKTAAPATGGGATTGGTTGGGK